MEKANSRGRREGVHTFVHVLVTLVVVTTPQAREKVILVTLVVSRKK